MIAILASNTISSFTRGENGKTYEFCVIWKLREYATFWYKNIAVMSRSSKIQEFKIRVG